MSDLFEDSDLLSEDYRRKDDDLDDDLDDQLLYSSEEEKEDFSKPVADLSITESSSILLSNSDQDKVNSSVILSDVPGYSMSTNTIVNQQLSQINGSDSEGTDTRDETDDRPLNGDDTARKKIKIYRRISNNSTDVTNTLETTAVSTEEAPQMEAEASVNYEDEDSDGDEKIERDRFRSERDIKALDISSKRRNSGTRNIPDTLEISQEDQQKIEEFNKQQKEKRFNKRNHNRLLKRGFTTQPRFTGKSGFLSFSGLQGAKTTFRPQVPTENPPFQQSILGSPPPNVWPLMRPPPPLATLPVSIPPPQWLGPRNFPPPPIVPIQSIGSLLNTPTLPAPAITAQAPIIRSSAPGAPVAETTNAVQQNQGNPIPTVMSLVKREAGNEPEKLSDSKSSRQAIFNKANRSSPKLSVKITRSRSKSPVPRNSKRIVLKPRKSRSRSPKSRSSRRPKRSRRRSRSYSPRRRSRSRSYSPKRRSPPPPRRKSPSSSRKSPKPSKPGKILINPHFKGARKLPTTALQTPATTASVVNPLFSFPPPPLPGANSLPRAHPPVNINVPPPPLPGTVVDPSSSRAPTVNVPPPPVTVPPPVIPPRISASPTITPNQTPQSIVNSGSVSLVPRPLLPPRPNVPPPILLPPTIASGVAPSQPPPPGVVPSQPLRPPTSINPSRPPHFNPNLPPPTANSTLFTGAPPIDITRPPPQTVLNMKSSSLLTDPTQKNLQFAPGTQPKYRLPERVPSAFIRPALNEQKFMGGKETVNSSGLTGETALTGPQVRSRLKPPPAAVPKRNSTVSNWKNQVETNREYEEQLKQQAEKRKQILQLKAQRRGKDDPSKNPLVAVIRGISSPTIRSVKISNIASATSRDSIVRLMKNIGPIENVEYKSEEKCFVGSFKSAVHAKEFAEKYNRYMLDLSYISISLLG